MTAHKHADMIKAKADNMELVKFNFENGGWVVAKNQSKIQFMPNGRYFLCLPKHKKAVLTLLNGGESQVNFFGNWTDEHLIAGWSPSEWYMNDKVESRIKPSKVNRWVAVRKSDKYLLNFLFESIGKAKYELSGEYWEFINIEVEI